MIDIERLRLARDADYETGSYLCGQGADEIDRLRYWLLKLDRQDIVDDANKFSGPEDERRKDAIEQTAVKEKTLAMSTCAGCGGGGCWRCEGTGRALREIDPAR